MSQSILTSIDKLEQCNADLLKQQNPDSEKESNEVDLAEEELEKVRCSFGKIRAKTVEDRKEYDKLKEEFDEISQKLNLKIIVCMESVQAEVSITKALDEASIRKAKADLAYFSVS